MHPIFAINYLIPIINIKKSFHLVSFPYNIDELPWELNLTPVYINQPMIKLVSIYTILLKVAELITTFK